MENDNLNNDLDNLIDIAADDNFAEFKENLFDKAVEMNGHQKDEDSGKSLEHKYVATRKKKKKKKKIHSEELDNRENNNNNKHNKNSNHDRIGNNNRSTSSSLFWVIVWPRKLMVFTLQKTLNTSF